MAIIENNYNVDKLALKIKFELINFEYIYLIIT